MTDFNQKTHDTDVGSHGGQSRQMMEVFENQEFGSIRLLQEAGKTFFCASDVAKALGYVNPYAAVKRHCRGPLTKREGVVQKVNQYGNAGEQVVEISFITEGDVYRLIVHSKLPSAERFEHWVFDEVLPSIRKHGVYMSDSILDQVIQHPEVIYTLAQELVAEREQLEGIRKQLDAAQPKADYFDTFVNSEDCTCIRNFCKEIGIPEKTAVALLLDHRYLYRSPSGWLMPFADKSARGYFIVRDCYGRSGKLVQQTRVTCKGKNHLFKLFKKWDSRIFLGGSEPTTLKELNQALGKETIDLYNTSDTRGNSPSYGTNYQKVGHDLASVDELSVLDGGKCILQLRGVRPFKSDKYDLTQHPNYKLTAGADKKNTFSIEAFLDHRLKLKPGDKYEVVDSSIRFELSFMNMATDASNFEKMVRIPYQKDHFNPVRTEYSTMLRRQLAQGNNGLTKTKYLTFGIEAESMKQAKPRLIHIEIDLMNNFKRLGVRAKLLNGKERLHLMHDMFHMGDHDRFNFDWKWLPESGLSVKDFIAPTGFAFPKNRIFQMGGMYGSMSYLQITASDLSDQLLKDFLDMESSQIVTMHIQSVDQNKAIKSIKHTITELDRSKIEEQKKAVRSGYDMDIIPSDLATYGKDAKALLKELQSQNERMFLLTFLVMNTGETEQELETNVFQASSIAQKYNCNLRRLDFQQEQGLMSCLPLAQNLIEIQRSMTTSSTAIFVPFTTQELFQTGKEALYYGLNALSNNLIMVDRKKLKNPNGLILGTPGSGKSFSAKREIANAFLVTDDDVIVCDPEAEYTALVQKFEGQVIKISPSSTQYINPMDINANYSEEDNPIALKADFILSLCELIVGGKEGLQPVEKTVIDRCVHQIYQTYFENPVPENMPVLQDLYEALLRQDEKEAHHVATALEIYVTGSLNLFNHRTNVDINNRLVCYDIKELGKQLKKIGMLVVQDQVWGRVTANRNAGKATRYYMDEFHLLLKEEQTAAYSVEIWKRFRKWGGIPTGITQNVKDLLSSREVTNIFENSDFIYMLNQAAGDRQILADQLNISPHQLSYVTHSGEGEGLLFYGNVILPFVDRFPTDLELYRIMTTKLTEVQEVKGV